MTKAEAMRQIREHLVILASYEVLDLNTADVLENYIGDFIDQIDEAEATFDQTVWDSIKSEKRKNLD